MSKSPAFQFYVQDFLVGVRRLTAEQIGGYMLLLCEQWDKGYLPDDDAYLMEISLLKPKSLAAVKAKFAKNDDGNLRNDRLEKERNKQLEFKKKSAEAGRKSGAARRGENRTNLEGTFNEPSTNLEGTLNSSSSISSSISSSESLGADAQPPDEKDSKPEQPKGTIPPGPPSKKLTPEQKALQSWESVTHTFPDSMLDEWMKLAKMQKWKGKELTAFETALKQLTKYDEAFARQLITNAIANNYQGLTFTSTDNDYQNWLTNKTKLNGSGKHSTGTNRTAAFGSL